MATPEARIADFAEKHLGMPDRAVLDADLSDPGVNSMDALNFLKTVNQEFGAEISPEVAAGFNSFRDLINHFGG